MIRAIVGVVHAYELLPYYLAHYRALGVNRFAVICDPDRLDSTGALTEMLSAQTDVDVISLPHRFQRSQLVGMIEEEVRAELATSDDWVIPADLDELNQYPCALAELVHELVRNDYSHVTGTMKDRLASDGTLAPLRPFDDNIPIWDQYPLEANVSRLTGGITDKVLMSRGDLSWALGHHRMRDGNLRPYPHSGVAHHFKWRDGLSRSLAWRVEHEKQAKVPWCRESEQLQAYLAAHGRVVPEHVDAVPGWQPSLSGVVG